MTQNDFYVAIQSILTQAHEEGWQISQIYGDAADAIEEWFEEVSVIMGDLDDTVLD